MELDKHDKQQHIVSWLHGGIITRLHEGNRSHRAWAMMCRAMRDLVDGPSHAAWALPGRRLLPEGIGPPCQASGADWQDFIR